MVTISAIYEKGKLRLLEALDLEEGQQVMITIQDHTPPAARDLLTLPVEERNRLLAEAAAKAEDSYRNDPGLSI